MTTEARMRRLSREDFIDEETGRVYEGTIIVKYIPKDNRLYGPYGYQVTYSGGRHNWKYLGRAEPGLPPGTYEPKSPLRFEKKRGKEEVLVGNWDDLRTDADLDVRLDRIGYYAEAVS